MAKFAVSVDYIEDLNIDPNNLESKLTSQDQSGYSEQLVSSSVVLVAWPWKMSEWSQREQVSIAYLVCVCS